jgi:hypothetical protein
MDQINVNQAKRRSDQLNVITILTIIGSVFALLSSLMLLFLDKFIEVLESSGAGSEQLDMMYKLQENLIPYLALNIVSSVLCLAGAILMRRLKKNGLPIYLVGEWLPVILGPLIIGTGGMGSLIFSIIVPAVFTILYLKCRPELTE